jgi:hypothetical protein
MKRPWLTLPDFAGTELLWIDVVQGIMQDGQPQVYGHDPGPDCDCCPQIMPNLDTLIIIHRADC